ncbi:hypothetical protein Plhal304r1_c076g0163261 [Plasmopara halstedii]
MVCVAASTRYAEPKPLLQDPSNALAYSRVHLFCSTPLFCKLAIFPHLLQRMARWFSYSQRTIPGRV